MTTSARRLSPDARRQQILDAARALYADRSYHQVSTSEVARAAKVTRGLVHHYFGTKRELFLEAMRSTVVMPAGELPTDLDTMTLAARARWTMDWILDGAATYGQGWVNVAGAVSTEAGSDLQALVDEADDNAARLVLDALALPDEPQLRTRLRTVAPLVKAACREWLQHHTLTRDDVLDLTTATVLAVLETAGFTGDTSPSTPLPEEN
ncbi:TetR/AcrR family transcriptional regulator [Nocardioides massiliensis]|uniref:AcrR family transcriptional regulator n=1 Tax=Nocardioides massiliensis TaxID=1325935 RepID=A0ABT9NMM8_9ACTN|nr:TetR/AcrR family transcriptional regulator [Nocardioides massiliensis]MDP9821678.1 AcrR family transcriptional regulator [Nocardioides massiliensis]